MTIKKFFMFIFIFLILWSFGIFKTYANGQREAPDKAIEQDDLSEGTEQFHEEVLQTRVLFSAFESTTQENGMEFQVKKLHEFQDGSKEYVDMYAQALVTAERSFFARFNLDQDEKQYALFVVADEIDTYFYGQGSSTTDFVLIYSHKNSDDWYRIPEDKVYSHLGNLLNVMLVQRFEFDHEYAARRIDGLANYHVEKF